MRGRLEGVESSSERVEMSMAGVEQDWRESGGNVGVECVLKRWREQNECEKVE